MNLSTNRYVRIKCRACFWRETAAALPVSIYLSTLIRNTSHIFISGCFLQIYLRQLGSKLAYLLLIIPNIVASSFFLLLSLFSCCSSHKSNEIRGHQCTQNSLLKQLLQQIYEPCITLNLSSNCIKNERY